MRLAAGAMALLMGLSAAHGHDIYKGVYGSSGRLCCGGDPVTGDCEALAPEQITELPDAFVFQSRRYNSTVLVPKSKIEYRAIPGEIPGTAGHWCGVPRIADPTPEQPDPAHLTYCAFVNPGST